MSDIITEITIKKAKLKEGGFAYEILYKIESEGDENFWHGLMDETKFQKVSKSIFEGAKNRIPSCLILSLRSPMA